MSSNAHSKQQLLSNQQLTPDRMLCNRAGLPQSERAPVARLIRISHMLRAI